MSLVVLPAGRSFRRSEEGKWVDPQPEKGIIELRLDQGIVNFLWRNKETASAEDELLIFPGEATFERVTKDKTGRSFMLKFSSSNQIHFFWLQRSNIGEADARAAVDINALLQDPDYVVGSAPIPSAYLPPKTPAPAASGERDIPATPSAPQKAASSTATAPPSTAGPSTATPAPAGQNTQNQDMARLLFQWADNHLPIPEGEDASLTDILTPDTVSRLVEEQPQLASDLAQHMPPDLDLGAGQDVATPAGLLRVVGTPQFRDAVSSLEMALRNGTLPESMIPWIQLPENSAWNLRTFLDALRKAEGSDDKEAGAADDKMDMDP